MILLHARQRRRTKRQRVTRDSAPRDRAERTDCRLPHLVPAITVAESFITYASLCRMKLFKKEMSHAES